DIEPCDLERSDVQPALRQIGRDRAAQHIALHRKARARRQQILDRHLARYEIDRLRDALADPRAPSLLDECLRVGNVIALDRKSQPIADRDRHSFLRKDADASAVLRVAVALIEDEAVELKGRQKRDAALHETHGAAPLVDTEDRPPRGRKIETGEDVQRDRHAGEQRQRAGKATTKHADWRNAELKPMSHAVYP